jgi:hypothetical protein
MQFSPAVTTVTRKLIPKKVYDTVTLGTPGLQTFMRTAKKWTTGTSYAPVIQYTDTTNGGNTGIANQLDSDRQNTRVSMDFEVKMAYKPVVIADIEATLNKGDEQVVELMETEFDTQAKSLLNVMAENLYSGTGIGNSWDSLANAASDSTTYATYGSLSRSTYTSINGYYLAAAGALTLAKLATGFDGVSVGMDEPSVILTTKAIWSSYEALLTPTLRASYDTFAAPNYDQNGMITGKSKANLGVQGFRAITYRGVPMVKDEQIPAGKLIFANQDAFGMKGVNITGKDYDTLNFKKTSDATPTGVPGNVPSAKGFNFRVMKAPVDQLSQVGYLLFAGNFCSENPRLLGTMADVT